MYDLKNYRTAEGTVKTVLVGPKGRKLLPVLMIEGTGLTVRKVPLDDQRYMEDVREEKKRRGMNALIRQYRGIGRRLGMTKAAKSFLTNATKAA